mmetsp:Transcript_37872/g.66413  ORF Transcript_37872/g.66413 Transcript_37872/m.66413 type:complete len:195 (+) Transcript_37872:666-1250(+)
MTGTRTLVEYDTNSAADGSDNDNEAAHKCNERADNNNIPKVHERGRPPSSVGRDILSWDEMLQSMTMDERKELIVSAIHPPYPFETEMKDDHAVTEEDVPHTAVICGALKDIGQTHLWERTRHLPEASDDKEHDGCEEGVEQNISEGGKEVFYGASAAQLEHHSNPNKSFGSKRGVCREQRRTTGASRDFNGCA